MHWSNKKSTEMQYTKTGKAMVTKDLFVGFSQDLDSDFSFLVRAALGLLKVSDSELARKIGVSVSTVTSWKDGKHVPRYNQQRFVRELLRDEVKAIKDWVEVDPSQKKD